MWSTRRWLLSHLCNLFWFQDVELGQARFIAGVIFGGFTTVGSYGFASIRIRRWLSASAFVVRVKTDSTRKTSVSLLEEMNTPTAVPCQCNHLLSFEVEVVCREICFDGLNGWYHHGNELESKNFACSILLTASSAAYFFDGISAVITLPIIDFAAVGNKTRKGIIRLVHSIGPAQGDHLLEAREHTEIFLAGIVSIANPDVGTFCVKRCALETRLWV